MTDDQILESMGLKQDQLSDLLKKQSDFLGSLDDQQRRVVLKSQRPVADVAAGINENLTAPQLESFLTAAGGFPKPAFFAGMMVHADKPKD